MSRRGQRRGAKVSRRGQRRGGRLCRVRARLSGVMATIADSTALHQPGFETECEAGDGIGREERVWRWNAE